MNPNSSKASSRRKAVCLITVSLLLMSAFAPLFKVSAESDPWWNYEWSYRKKVTIDHNEVTSDLANFPVLISITDSDLSSRAQSNGDDIAFTDESACKLNHEIEYFGSSTGELVAWVDVPSVSSTSDTVLYMYYGNPSAPNQQNAPETWDSDYVLVQHLQETTGTHYDSTSYGNNGTAMGSLNQNAEGKIDGADEFDGSTNCYVQIADDDSLDGMSALTIEAWVKQSSYHANGIVNKNANDGYMLQGWSDQRMYFAVSGTTDRAMTLAGSYPLNQWYHLVAVSTGTQLLIYVNGTQRASSNKTTGVQASTAPVQIGWAGGGTAYYFIGFLDEVRISQTARSEDWINTAYSNQNNPSTFCTIGSQETPPEDMIIANETPQDGAINIQLNPTLRAYFANYLEGLMNITFSTNITGPWVPIDSYTNVGNGYYTAEPTNMDQYETEYWWKAEAEDTAHAASTSETFHFTTKPWNVAPTVSNPSPANQSPAVSPSITQLTFDLSDLEDDPMNYTVTTSPNIGSGSGTDVPDGSYSVSVSGLLYSTTYTWTVNATDGKDTTLAVYTFTTQPIQTGVQYIGDYACMGLDYLGSASDKNTAYAVWQGPIDVTASGVAVWFAKFDRTQGWVITNQSVFDPPWGERHPLYGYWDDSYHVGWFDGAGQLIALADNRTFEGFQSVDGSAAEYNLPGSIPGNSVPSAYAFSNEYVWVIGSDTSTGDETIAYWKWTKETGWSTKTIISSTANPTHGTNFPALLPVNQTAWYMYYTAYPSTGSNLYYVKSTDQGQTWGAEQASNIASQVSRNSRPSFARYGDNFYIFLIDTAGDVVIYNSTDGVTWANKQILYTPSSYYCAQGYAVDQETLVWTASDTTQPRRSSQNHYGVGDQYGGVYLIPEMLANPETPTISSPSNETILASGTTSTQLQTVVHGTQTYDVAFYWANGTFAGEDKLLTEGDIANITVTGLSDAETYQWYAVARGATCGYWGGEPASTTDENRSDTWTFSVQERQKPYVLNENPQNGAADVSVSVSQLAFTIADPQSNLMSYSVKTFPDIGADSATEVGNGTYAASIYPLKKSRSYTWQVNVTDGTNWTNMTYAFSTELVPTTFDPFEEGWRYRKTITINHAQVAADLADFPALIGIVTDPDLAAHAQTDGDDILFMDATGVATKLDHEIELYDNADGSLAAWVKIPLVSSTADTVLYMYYGNPYAINQENMTGTWDSDYVLVQHLDETSGTHYDSTAYANSGTPLGGLTQDVTGKIDGADQLDGSDDYVQVADADSLDGMATLTVEIWLKQSTHHANGIVNKGGATTNYAYLLQGWSDQQLYFAVNGGASRAVASAGSYPLNEWYHVVGVSNGTHLIIYVNGVEKAASSKTTAVPVDSYPVQIGQNGAGSPSYFIGSVDEVRISKTARSAAWISASYNSQNDPATFFTLGSEEEAETRIRVLPSNIEAAVGDDVAVYVAVDYVTDLYGWEFQLNYSASLLNAASTQIVPGGLNEPTHTYYDLIDGVNGHLWWGVTTTNPPSYGISYYEHAIFKIDFEAMTTGASSLDLHGTYLGDSGASPISHVVDDGSILIRGADLSVTDITILDQGCSIYKNQTHANGSSYYYPVEVTIYNDGDLVADGFYVNLEVYWINGSLTETSEEMYVADLAVGTGLVVNFTNLFHPMHTGRYRLIATVDSQSNVTEGDETNNTLQLDNIPVTVMGDISGDGVVDVSDAVIIALAWGATPADPQWNIKADVNNDKEINILDAARLTLHWGQTW